MGLLQEILNSVPENNKEKLLENRADHAYTAVMNFVKIVKENYNEEQSTYLIKKFLMAVRDQNPKLITKHFRR